VILMREGIYTASCRMPVLYFDANKRADGKNIFPAMTKIVGGEPVFVVNSALKLSMYYWACCLSLFPVQKRSLRFQ
jgi:hypothetical protein